MAEIVLFLHSILRYVIIVAALGAIALAIRGWLMRAPFTALADRLGMIYTTGLHTQLLVGLVLYGFMSSLTQAAFANMGAAMSSTAVRFYAVEHISIMILAIIVATVGRVLVRRAKDDASKNRLATIFYTLSFAMILVSIPWPWSAEGVSRPLNPFHMFLGQ